MKRPAEPVRRAFRVSSPAMNKANRNLAWRKTRALGIDEGLGPRVAKSVGKSNRRAGFLRLFSPPNPNVHRRPTA